MIKTSFTCMFILLFNTFLKAQYYQIPDSNFRSFMQSQFPACFNGNGELDTTCSDLYTFNGNINVSNMNISDLSGIRFVHNIQTLDCSHNQLTTIPNFKNNQTILTFNCSYNQITQIPVNTSPFLYINTFNCSHNQIVDIENFNTYYNSPNFIDCSYNLISTIVSCASPINCSYNQITTVGSFGSGKIDCSHNLISSIGSFGTGSKSLINCSYNQLTTLPAMTFSWSGANPLLDCSHNQLSSLPVGYGYGSDYDISYNNFTTLPELFHLSDLNCSHNNLTALDLSSTLSANLGTIDCSYNQITEIDTGLSLAYLFCSNNQLTQIPLFNPWMFQALDCRNNLITSLAQCPITTLLCSNNPLNCLPPLSDYLIMLDIDSTQLTCIPNYPIYYPSSLTINLPICNAVGICETFPVISGTIFLDLNNNQVIDTNESKLPSFIVESLPNHWYGSSDNQGYYYLLADTGVNVTVNAPLAPSPYFIVSPSSYSFYFNSMNQTDSMNNFAVYPIPNINDAEIQLAGIPPIPGGTSLYTISVSNIGTTTQNGFINFNVPDSLTFISATPTPDSINGNALVWNLSNLNILDFFSINLLLETPLSVPLGTQLHFEANIIGNLNDSTPLNNIVILDQEVVGPFDPNDKIVSDSLITETQVQNEHWLDYTIRFQNTGTFNAYNISVIDTISNLANIASLQILVASHNYIVTVREHGIVTFKFPAINLPDSNSNEALSHGYIKYRVRTTANLLPGDQVLNTAFIYFDYNPPIQTNTTQTEVQTLTFNTQLENSSFFVYPNPMNAELNIKSTLKLSSVAILNYAGQILFEKHHLKEKNLKLFISDIPSGIYFLRVEDEFGKIGFEKIIKSN